jgi:hypothetical protein
MTRVSETENHSWVHIPEIAGSTPVPATRNKNKLMFSDISLYLYKMLHETYQTDLYPKYMIYIYDGL